jgi:hypothetical protein
MDPSGEDLESFEPYGEGSLGSWADTPFEPSPLGWRDIPIFPIPLRDTKTWGLQET